MQDMIAAATDTSSVTNEWVMAEVIKNPRVLRRIQEELDAVRHLPGWTTLELAGRIRASSLPLGNLRPAEFVLLVSHISARLALPISFFFLLLLEEFGLQL